MVAGTRLMLVPERLVAGGDALARAPDGKVVFVEGGLPGERVLVGVRERRRDFDRAVVVSVESPSPDRVSPPCSHVARGCGGCDWQHLSLDGQRRARVEIVRESLARLARLPDARVDHAGGPAAPRTTIRVGAAADGRLGYRARRSHRVVGVDSCLVAHPMLVDLLRSLRVRGAPEITLRCSIATRERVAFWEGTQTVTVDGLPDGVAAGPASSLYEEVCGVSLRLSAGSFFQPSPQAAEALVHAVGEAAGPIGADQVLVDAYGGVGLFGATVGATAGRVVLVEAHPSSAADARVNLPGRQVVAARVEEWTPRGIPAGAATVVVADPPRAGLGAVAAERLAGLGAERLVVVNCDAAALGRDAGLLQGLGYRHERSVVVDHFPYTHHVEVVTRFAR